MLKEVIKYLNVQEGDKVLDGTLGGASYTLAIAKKIGERGRVISIDLDKLAICHAQEIIKEKKLNNITLVLDNFKNIEKIVDDHFSKKIDAVVLDLGLSSAQLDDEERGFSFKGKRPLDMAFGDSNISTKDIVNNYSLQDLTNIFKEYGEEQRSYYIARAIVDYRKNKEIETTEDLVRIIEEEVPFRYRRNIHPATRIFQALRMETNGELNNLRETLSSIENILKPKGRLVVVSFHSGEDRIVKRFLKNNNKFKILTKKPLVPGQEEINNNFRSRSAKLRVAERI